jgi:enoyl-CoA hydratase/carnithine racemase
VTGQLPRFETLLLDVEDGIATITLNRPERMNAFQAAMRDELLAAFDYTDGHDAIRAVILTGAGRAFCAGADLSSGGFEAGRVETAHERPHLPRDGAGVVTLRLFDSVKPLIVAVNGVAVGFGASVTLTADIRLASTSARFGFLFAKRGIVSDGAASWFLPRIVGISRALEWAYSGRLVSGPELTESGLVREVVEPDALLARAREVAQEMTGESAAVSVAVTRQLLWRMLGADHPMQAHIAESRALYSRMRSADAKEGVASFLEKRDAHFPLGVSCDLPHVLDSPGPGFPDEEIPPSLYLRGPQENGDPANPAPSAQEEAE